MQRARRRTYTPPRGDEHRRELRARSAALTAHLRARGRRADRTGARRAAGDARFRAAVRPRVGRAHPGADRDPVARASATATSSQLDLSALAGADGDGVRRRDPAAGGHRGLFARAAPPPRADCTCACAPWSRGCRCCSFQRRSYSRASSSDVVGHCSQRRWRYEHAIAAIRPGRAPARRRGAVDACRWLPPYTCAAAATRARPSSPAHSPHWRRGADQRVCRSGRGRVVT